ncbi:MAG: c-type cytochrome [Myxococcales bacterium]|nr:c-type cytochrome [Myxococcales bacterium]
MKSTLTIALVLAAAALAGCGSHGEPTGSVCPQGSTLTYQNFGKSFMDTYCTDCHSSAKTGAARHGAPAFHDYDTVEGVRNTIDHVDENAAAGPDAVNTLMPADDPRPTEAERRQLGEWLACGAP